MSLTYYSGYTGTGSTSVSISGISRQTVGSIMLATVVNKPTTVTPSTPSGYTLLATSTGGTGSDGGADGTGPVRVSIYWKRVSSLGTETFSVNAGASTVTTAVVQEFYSTVGGISDPVNSTTGTDSTVNTAVSIAYAGTGSLEGNNLAVLCTGYCQYIPGNPELGSAPTLTSTGGTFSLLDRGWHATTQTGKDASAWMHLFRCTTGTVTSGLTFASTTAGGWSLSGHSRAVQLVETFTGSESGTGTETAQSISRTDPTESDTGTFSEAENVTYTNINRDLSDGDNGAGLEGTGTDVNWTDDETMSATELAVGFIDDPQIIFNNDLNNPGFDITLSGLLDGPVSFQKLSLLRRDPTGVYSDEYVRGMHDVTITSNVLLGSDYEAPLGIVLDYYADLYDGVGHFLYGPIHPTPQTFIPTQPTAYGGGVAYLKNIDSPLLAKAVAIESFPSWRRSVNVLAEHHVLGRRNPVVVTDVLGGRKGSFKLNVLMPEGQEIAEIENLLNPGSTMLLQNNNYIVSGFKDMYFRITGDVEIERRNLMVTFGPQETSHLQDVIITVNIEFTEVDRPDTTGVTVTTTTWQDVLTNQSVWTNVKNNNTDWTQVTGV